MFYLAKLRGRPSNSPDIADVRAYRIDANESADAIKKAVAIAGREARADRSVPHVPGLARSAHDRAWRTRRLRPSQVEQHHFRKPDLQIVRQAGWAPGPIGV